MKWIISILAVSITFAGSYAQSVGIGTNSPHLSAKLDITDSTRGLLIPRLTTIHRTAIASPAKGLIVFDSTTNSLWYHDGASWGELSAINASAWKKTGNNLYNTNSGNIGIGTISPSDKLEINGNLRFTMANPYITASSYLVVPGGAYFSGGTVYAANQIQARGGVNNDQGTLTLTGSNGVVNSASTYFMVAGKYAIDGSDGYLRLNQQNSYPNGTYTPYNIFTDGRIGIGANPANFPLSFASSTGDKISLWGTNPAAHYGFGIQGGELQIFTDISSSTIALGYGGSGSFTTSMYVYGNGNAYMYGYLTQGSDLRLKKNVKFIEHPLEKIMQLNGYNYFWNDRTKDQSMQTGVIAQEVERTMPELVKVDEKGMLSVNYSGLIPYLIESIKEQQVEIKQQQAKLQELSKEKEEMKKIKIEIADLKKIVEKLSSDETHSILLK